MYGNQLFNRGFTLMELLVVIAIIGILAAIILSTLSDSRNKGSDGAVKSNLLNARSQADLYYNLNGNSYDGVCGLTTATSTGRMVNAAKRAYGGSVTAYVDGTASTWDTEQCHDSVTAWAAWVPLRASQNGSPVGWCVDSTTASQRETAVLAAGSYACP